MGERNVIKVAGFTLCKCGSTYNVLPDDLFPIKWSSPETLMRTIITSKSDVWSFGEFIINPEYWIRNDAEVVSP